MRATTPFVCYLLCVAALAAGWASAAEPGDESLLSRVVVVRNDSSAISREIADDYIRRRGVRHVVTVRCQDAARDTAAESIPVEAYREQIETPLRAFLSRHPHVDYIVLTKGVPLRIETQDSGVRHYALDSRLAALDYAQLNSPVSVPVSDPSYGADFQGRAWANRFWNSREHFSHERFGGYLVSRLDGYTAADAKALTSRALQAERAAHDSGLSRQPILLDVAPQFGFAETDDHPHNDLSRGLKTGEPLSISRESSYGWFNDDMGLAARQLREHHYTVELETSTGFAGSREPLIGYVSFGSNDPGFDAGTYRSLRFVPGAVAETAVSTSARTFLPTEGGQSLIADLIHQGVTGVKGYSDEPLLQAIASPSILFDRYTRGWTLAESFFAASSLVGWEDILVGDPLTRAYPRGP
jgi:hypothetical protein